MCDPIAKSSDPLQGFPTEGKKTVQLHYLGAGKDRKQA